jgi:ParB-like chromosome segregation protein Spo0J
MEVDDQSGAPPAAPPAEPPAEPTPPEAPAAEERPTRSHVAPALVALDRVDDDGTFRVRPEGDIAGLATDVARLGQLFPVDLRLKPPDRFQVISGFRRVAALRFLQRDRVLARLHTDLSDEDALLLSLAAAIHRAPVSRDELSTLRARLEQEGRLTPTARDMLEKALAVGDPLAPEAFEPEGAAGEAEEEEEVDADELAADVARRLGAINQDLSALADVFASLDDDRRKELLTQLHYSADLVAFLEGK